MAKPTCEFSEKVPTGAPGIHTYYFRCTWDEHDRNTYSVQANGANVQQALALALERVPFEPDHPHHEHRCADGKQGRRAGASVVPPRAVE